MTFPSGEAQEQLIQSLYRPAGLAPESLEYIEAHGTGTKVKALSSPYLTLAHLLERFLAAALTYTCPLQVGDPQELNSIVRALCASRQGALLIGSTKSNMGHPEPASGLAALAKVSRSGSDMWIAVYCDHHLPTCGLLPAPWPRRQGGRGCPVVYWTEGMLGCEKDGQF